MAPQPPLSIRGGRGSQTGSAQPGSVSGESSTLSDAVVERVSDRLDRIEDKAKADTESVKRLTQAQRDLETKVDRIQDGMDYIADQCTTANAQSEARRTDDLATLTGKIDSIVTSMNKLEARPQGKSCECDTKAPIKPPTAPAVGSLGPSSSSMVNQMGSAPAGGPTQPGQSQPGPSQPGLSAPGTPVVPSGTGHGNPTPWMGTQGEPVAPLDDIYRTHASGIGTPQYQARPSWAMGRPSGIGSVPMGTLITESDQPRSFNPPTDGARTHYELGKHCPGITEPHRTNITEFDKLVDYRAYRLPNTRAELTPFEVDNLQRIKKALDSNVKIPVYNGGVPMALLPFLRTFTRGCEHQGLSEAVAARFLPLYLEGTAEHITTQRLGQWDPYRDPYARTLPHLVHQLIQRLLTDDILKTAIEGVTTVQMLPQELEGQFCDRVVSAAYLCGGVFSDYDIATHIRRGLPKDVTSQINALLRQRDPSDRANLAVVRDLAVQAGETARGLIERAQQMGLRTPTVRPARGKALSITDFDTPAGHMSAYDTPGSARFGTLAPYPDIQDEPFEVYARDQPSRLVDISSYTNKPVPGDQLGLSYTFGDALHVVDSLEPILSVGMPGRAESIASSVTAEDGNPDAVLDISTIPIPVLTKEQTELAYQVVPDDYWALNCWVCRDNGHAMFKCPYLTGPQRLYFAYRYYLYQVQKTPHMRKFLQDRAIVRQQRRQVSQTQPQVAAPEGHAQAPMPDSRAQWQPRPNRDGFGGGGRGRGQGAYKPWVRPNSPRQNRQVQFRPQDRVHILQHSERQESTADQRTDAEQAHAPGEHRPPVGYSDLSEEKA